MLHLKVAEGAATIENELLSLQLEVATELATAENKETKSSPKALCRFCEMPLCSAGQKLGYLVLLKSKIVKTDP